MSNVKTARLTRRQFLAAATVLGTGAGLGTIPRPARALADFNLGDHKLSVLSDGHLSLPVSFLLPDRTPEEIETLFAPHGMSTAGLTPDCNITLLRSADRLVLFDVGAGGNFQPSAGALPSALEDAGIDPTDITDVILTHAHPDHLWGMLDDFDDPLYPEATVWVPEAEWTYWRASDTLDKTPEARKSFVVGAQARFEAIEDQVQLVKPGQEVLPGVEAFDTSGHTPGHMSYVVHSASESVMVLGDAITNAVISFEQPGWVSGSDQDPEKGIATRVRLLDRLATDQSRIIGFHLPEPGHGRVERAGTAYRFVAS